MNHPHVLRHRATREVTTRSGTTFTVPAGISRNHGAGCWVVTYGKRDWKPVSYRAGGERVSLEHAKAELVRRIHDAREQQTVTHVDRIERVTKARFYGRPGVRFQTRTHRCGYFTATVFHKHQKKRLDFRVDFEPSHFRERLEVQWRLAIVARDVMLEWVAAGQWRRVAALTSKSIPVTWQIRAQMLDMRQMDIDGVAKHVLKERDAL